jgi:DNA-binding NarL/FixJ family response regulator
VVRLLAEGYSNSEIADQLGIAVDTVKQHCKHIFSKLEVNNRTAAASAAVELGIIDPPYLNKKSINTTVF